MKTTMGIQRVWCRLQRFVMRQISKKQYRIIEQSRCGTTSTWKIEKKSFLGFWYNPENLDGYTTGYYDTLDEAKKAIERKTTPTKKTVVFESAT